MRVLKFGGTSMGDEHTWRQVLHIIQNYDHPTVIVSATARTTRKLVAAADLALRDFAQAESVAKEIQERHMVLIRNFAAELDDKAARQLTENCEQWIKCCTEELGKYLWTLSTGENPSASVNDAVASIGEQLSSRLFAYCGQAIGLKTEWVNARKVIKTDSDYGRANPIPEKIGSNVSLISELLGQGAIPVMGGYYGEDEHGNITTLGFEGSDFSASLVGSALNAEAIEIWTDVSGIYTCDPRVVDDAFPIAQLSFREATEMAYFGAKVLHPSTMNPAEEKQIPIFVKNIFEPGHSGTKIQGKAPGRGKAKAMTFLRDVEIITINSPHTRMGYDFLAGIFGVLKQYHLSVSVVTTTEASISLAMESKKITPDFIASLKKWGQVSRKDRQGIISLIGCRFANSRDIQEMILDAVPGIKITMISYSDDKQNFNVVLPQKDLVDSVKAIHKVLFIQEK